MPNRNTLAMVKFSPAEITFDKYIVTNKAEEITGAIITMNKYLIFYATSWWPQVAIYKALRDAKVQRATSRYDYFYKSP